MTLWRVIPCQGSTIMLSLLLLPVFFHAVLCGEIERDLSSDSSDADHVEIHTDYITETVNPHSPLALFLDNFPGPGDVGALESLFANRLATPSEALLGLLRSEKCWNGHYDCSQLVLACNEHGAFINSRTDLDDIECYFKYWVLHRDRCIKPSNRLSPNYTLYMLVAMLVNTPYSGTQFDDLAVMKLAVKHETRPPTKLDMDCYFTPFPGFPKFNMHLKVLEFLLSVETPIYSCMLLLVCTYALKSSPIANDPRMLEYAAPACADNDWFDLAFGLLCKRSTYSAIKYIIDSLELGASINCRDRLTPLERVGMIQADLQIPVAALLLPKGFPSRDFMPRDGKCTVLIKTACDYWMKFKLLMAIIEQEDECTCNALKNVFLRTTGFAYQLPT